MKKPLHIIIDGADGLGKTTVCTKLGRRLNIPVIKMPNMSEYIKKGSAEEFSKLFNETITQFSEFDFVLDRGFTSSLVYNEVFDRKFPMEYIENIENILQPHIFILTGKNDDGKFKYFRADNIFDRIEIEKVDTMFLEMAELEDWTVVRSIENSPDQIVEFIISNL